MVPHQNAASNHNLSRGQANIGTRRARTTRACNGCRTKKTRCEGGIPCSQCRIDDTLCQSQRRAGGSLATSALQLNDDNEKIRNLTGAVKCLYAMVRNREPWKGQLPRLNSRNEPVIHDILSILQGNQDLPAPLLDDIEGSDLQDRFSPMDWEQVDGHPIDTPRSIQPLHDPIMNDCLPRVEEVGNTYQPGRVEYGRPAGISELPAQLPLPTNDGLPVPYQATTTFENAGANNFSGIDNSYDYWGACRAWTDYYLKTGNEPTRQDEPRSGSKKEESAHPPLLLAPQPTDQMDGFGGDYLAHINSAEPWSFQSQLFSTSETYTPNPYIFPAPPYQ